MSLFRLRKAQDSYICFLANMWGRSLIRVAGGKVTVSGLENIPVQNNICFISNHQGVFDIPLIVGYIPKAIGFIAKKELVFIPVIGLWIKVIHCIFIDRSNKRKSVQTIQQGVKNIATGHPMVIFPEGTRSQSNKMGEFKSGSLKLALRSNALVIPLTIDGSYKIREENNGIITPASVNLTVHPVIDISVLNEEEKKNLAGRLWKIIHSGLESKS
jgi:1-acyl-sn-glycerol-3-phosphate acyltransferase